MRRLCCVSFTVWGDLDVATYVCVSATICTQEKAVKWRVWFGRRTGSCCCCCFLAGWVVPVLAERHKRGAEGWRRAKLFSQLSPLSVRKIKHDIHLTANTCRHHVLLLPSFSPQVCVHSRFTTEKVSTFVYSIKTNILQPIEWRNRREINTLTFLDLLCPF